MALYALHVLLYVCLHCAWVTRTYTPHSPTYEFPRALRGDKHNCEAPITLVWDPDPSVKAHARAGKEGSGEMDGFARAKAGM